MTDEFADELPRESWKETCKSLLRAGSNAATKATEVLIAKTRGAAADIAAKASAASSDCARYATGRFLCRRVQADRQHRAAREHLPAHRIPRPQAVPGRN